MIRGLLKGTVQGTLLAGVGLVGASMVAPVTERVAVAPPVAVTSATQSGAVSAPQPTAPDPEPAVIPDQPAPVPEATVPEDTAEVAVPAESRFNQSPGVAAPPVPEGDQAPATAQVAEPVTTPDVAAPTPDTQTAAAPDPVQAAPSVAAPAEGGAPQVALTVETSAPQTPPQSLGQTQSTPPPVIVMDQTPPRPALSPAAPAEPAPQIAEAPETPETPASPEVAAEVEPAVVPAVVPDVVPEPAPETQLATPAPDPEIPAPAEQVAQAPAAEQTAPSTFASVGTFTTGASTITTNTQNAPPETSASDTAPETGTALEIAPETEPGTGTAPVVAETEDAGPAVVPALEAFAVPFDGSRERPVLGVIIIDSPESELDRATLLGFAMPVAFAVDASRPDAAQAVRRFREAGFEVLLHASSLPTTGTVGELATAFAGALEVVDEAVAVLDTTDGFLQQTRVALDAVMDGVKVTGHGFLAYPQGLNAGEAAARREGVPGLTLYRLLDADRESKPTIGRYMDRALLAAGQEGHAIVVGHSYQETVTALYAFQQSLRDGDAVAVAPISHILKEFGTQ